MKRCRECGEPVADTREHFCDDCGEHMPWRAEGTSEEDRLWLQHNQHAEGCWHRAALRIQLRRLGFHVT